MTPRELDRAIRPDHCLVGPFESRRILTQHDAWGLTPVRRRVILEHYTRPGRGRIWTPERDEIKRPKHASFISPSNPNPHRGFNYLFGDPGSTDPFAAQVIFLSHFDNSVVNVVNNATSNGSSNVGVSATQAKFGATSLFRSGAAATDFLSYAYYAAMLEMNGTFTIEGWLFPTSFVNLRRAFGYNRDFAGQTWFTFCNGVGGIISTAIHAVTGSTVRALTANDWNYYAMSLVGANARTFLALPGEANTTLESTVAMGSGTIIAGSTMVMMNEWSLGSGTDKPWNGFIDEVRFTASTTVNAGRYTAAFPTPSAPFSYP